MLLYYWSILASREVIEKQNAAIISEGEKNTGEKEQTPVTEEIQLLCTKLPRKMAEVFQLYCLLST